MLIKTTLLIRNKKIKFWWVFLSKNKWNKNLNIQIDFNYLTYYFGSKSSSSIYFIGFKTLLHLYRNIIDGSAKLAKLEEDQKQFKSYLNKITKGNRKHLNKCFKYYQ